MSSPIMNVSEFYYDTNGFLLEKVGSANFFAQNNFANLLLIHLEDGNGENQTNLINFTPEKNVGYTSHWFFLSYQGITEKAINGVVRVFGTFAIVVPKLVLQNNKGDSAVENVINVVKRYGSENLGNYEDVNELNVAHTPNETLNLDRNFAYVYGASNDNGFYQVEYVNNGYEWVKKSTLTVPFLQKQYGGQSNSKILVNKGQANPHDVMNIDATTTQMVMQIVNNLQQIVVNQGTEIDVIDNKLLEVVNEVEEHVNDSVKHITAGERNTWNNKVDEAPIDGKEYVRKNASWVENSGGDQGYPPDNVTIVLTDEGELSVSENLELDGGFL